MKTITSVNKPTAANIVEGDVWEHTHTGEKQVFNGTDFAPDGQTLIDAEIDSDDGLSDEQKAAEHARLEQERKDFQGQLEKEQAESQAKE